ncbi:hypothetical protein ZOSMA_21G00100 [Zostera marina]|uniref:DNL-type domain-containing protein n=1 Tax=Zostera marina TaxID=29655 RepID=A0A0K9PJD7_ZOSMR|nr:hypothetical protein ZOSMA_21G00100 [Zostera marina]
MVLVATAPTTNRTSTISSFSSTSSSFLPPYLPLQKRQIQPIFVSIPSARRFLTLQISCCSRRKLIAYACINRSSDEESGLPVNLDKPCSSDSDKGVRFDTKLPRRRLMIEFTCNSCGDRTRRIVNRLAYEKGTVFVQCAGCLLHHKLVDNLGLVVEYDLQTDDA